MVTESRPHIVSPYNATYANPKMTYLPTGTLGCTRWETVLEIDRENLIRRYRGETRLLAGTYLTASITCAACASFIIGPTGLSLIASATSLRNTARLRKMAATDRLHFIWPALNAHRTNRT